MDLGLTGHFVVIVAGFFALIWSADRFVLGASTIAKQFGISPMVIGLTVVAIGTSAPEIVVSLTSTLQGYGGMAIGNAVGSNIANMTLVLGVAALIAPIAVNSNVIRREFPLLFAVILFAGLLMEDGAITRTGAVLLLVALVMTLHFIVRIALEEQDNRQVDNLEAVEDDGSKRSTLVGWAWIAVGLAIMVVSSKFIVTSATDVATALGVSEVVIGLTILAVGTSLPEVATTAVSAMKGEHEMAIGNVIGSNIFNLLAVLGVTPLVGAVIVPDEILSRDYVLMALVTIVVFVMSIGWRKQKDGSRQGRISRVEGAAMIAVFIGYCYVLYYMQ